MRQNKKGNIAHAIHKKFTHYLSMNKTAWADVLATGRMVDSFLQGKQLLRPTFGTQQKRK
jgi:hypothetical protein